MTPAFFAFAAGACLAVDGDTIKCQGVRIRLLRIDAVERGEPGFKEATDHLRMLIQGRVVTCRFKPYRDKYGRPLGECGTEATPSLSDAMLVSGHAKVYRGKR